jgi:hypothetical protein
VLKLNILLIQELTKQYVRCVLLKLQNMKDCVEINNHKYYYLISRSTYHVFTSDSPLRPHPSRAARGATRVAHLFFISSRGQRERPPYRSVRWFGNQALFWACNGNISLILWRRAGATRPLRWVVLTSGFDCHLVSGEANCSWVHVWSSAVTTAIRCKAGVMRCLSVEATI